MATLQLSTKRLQLDKANVMIVIVVSIACFITVFSLVAAKSLTSQLAYQNRVIKQKEIAKRDLVASVQGRNELVKRYKSFVGGETNIIGGTTSTDGQSVLSDRSGDNAKVVLDALPSTYDYPALTASLEKLLTVQGITISTIGGTDDEINQSAQTSKAKPTAIDVPFTLTFSGDKNSTQNVLTVLQRSIRPIQIQQITIAGSEAKLSTSITAKTYYQPETAFSVTKKVVK